MRILTYQDFLACADEGQREQFIRRAVERHENSEACRTAAQAQRYAGGRNELIERYQKLLYTVTGAAVPDTVTANHKCKSGFFRRFVTQRAAYLLGNGVSFHNPALKKALGADFDGGLYFAARDALVDGAAFGFYHLGGVAFFRLTEFAPLYDEESGRLRAGVRFWSLGEERGRRLTLYEEDGYTDYFLPPRGALQKRGEKQAYLRHVEVDAAGAERLVREENYGRLPIVPLFANRERQSTLVGIKEQIDCYDLIKSGFANDLDDASVIYWTLENTGGMDDVDLAQFVERMKTVRAAVVDGDGGAKAEAHTLEVPFQSREVYLSRLKRDLYDDYMALDPAEIAAGTVTATQIRAAYEPLNEACDELEFCVLAFLRELAEIVGEADAPTFTRSAILNVKEETETLLAAADFLDPAFVKDRLMRLLGEGDANQPDE